MLLASGIDGLNPLGAHSSFLDAAVTILVEESLVHSADGNRIAVVALAFETFG